MGTYTPNLNLYKPDASDDFGSFRAEFNDNMDKLDNGGGGGGGGHTIVDENGSDMPAESKLQFTGNVSVTDDNVNGATVVDVLGGGGAVLGAFVDTNRLLVPTTSFQTSYSYTATEDCFVCLYVVPKENDDVHVDIDGEKVVAWWRGSAIADETTQYVRKGQTISVVNAHSSYNSFIWVYGLTQGTNGIYAPVIYSDNERVIGVWRDNKPLYQKTFLFHSTDSQGNYVFQDVSSLNIDSCVEIKGTCDRNVAGLGAIIYDMNSFENNQYQTYLGYSAFNGKIQYTIKLPVGETTTWQVITIRYTKTTDVAGSGNWNTDGVPTHHYSTSEQVIGTYFGKPLYEKTWDNLSIGIDGTNWVYFNDPVDIENVIKFDAYYNNTDRYLHCAISEYQRSNSNGIMFSGFNGMNRTVNRIVAQYTKTTD